MISGKKLIVVMPAYNAARTLRRTYAELPHEYVDEVILVDDASSDDTAAVAEELNIRTVIHSQNRGYGSNQKTCYRTALELGADIVVMVHPDYQYSPRLVTAMASMITSRHYAVVLASRILGGGALKGGMPLYKYAANRFLTLYENMMLGLKLSEYHTGYRAFSREVLETLPLEEDSDGFAFDNEMIVQAVNFGFPIGEISCPTRYFPEASTIRFWKSAQYGIAVVATAARFRMHQMGIIRDRRFSPGGRTLLDRQDPGV